MNIISVFTELSSGFKNTLIIFFLTALMSIPLGIIIMLAKKSKFMPLSKITSYFISHLRGPPLMLQLMFVYYGPAYLMGLNTLDRFTAVIVAFVLNYACYFAEIYRGGFDAIPKGQYEASKVLGLSTSQTFFKIILPQVVKTVLPSITNEVITLVKDTSLAFVIAVSETFTVAKAMSARTSSLTPLIAVGVFYYVMNYLVAFIFEKFENRLNYYR